jgi:fatty-acid desaturase
MSRAVRITNILVVAIPFVAFVGALATLWNEFVGPLDLLIAFVMYMLTILGVTIGFHRYLTHRAFQTSKPMEYLLAILGSMAIEGPVVNWVADHRKHHAHTDVDGDPHSPHGHGSGLAGTIKGLWHAHVGWLWEDHGIAERTKYARDLVEDRGRRIINLSFGPLVALSLAIPFFLGWAIGGTLHAGLTAFLWGGLVRVFLLHDVVDQLGVPLLRPPPFRHRRSVNERLLAGAVELRRGLAPQSPRVPALGLPRAAQARDRPRGVGDRGPGEARTGLERRAYHARTPSAEDLSLSGVDSC